MPRIDDIKIQDKVFKKKEYRSWDRNLLDKLKIPRNKNQTKVQSVPISNAEAESSPSLIGVQIEANQGSNKVRIGFDKDSTTVQPEFDQGSSKVLVEFNNSSNRVQANPDKRVQLGFILDLESIRRAIRKLGGNEKKLFFFVINLCAMKGTLSTGEVLGEDLNNAITSTRNGRETAIKRIIKKGLLQREQGKTGANGTLNLYTSELIKTEALNYLNTHQSEQELMMSYLANRVQNQGSISSQLGSNNSPISISNYNKNNTTRNLPEEWKEINFEPLLNIGFSETQLVQLFEKNLNIPEVIQESIHHFAFGQQHNPKHKEYKEPLNVLMGVLRKGQRWYESHYESPQDKALKEILAEQKIKKEKNDRMLDELMNLDFPEWRKLLGEDEIKTIVPENILKTNFTTAIESSLRVYFKEKILIPKLKAMNAYK